MSATSNPSVPLRLSAWAAIWVGFIVGAGLATLLLLLLVALGASILSTGDAWYTLLNGTAVVTPLVILIALHIGAWMAATLSAPNRLRGALTGTVVWGLASLLLGGLSVRVASILSRYNLSDAHAASANAPWAVPLFAVAALCVAIFAGASAGAANGHCRCVTTQMEIRNEARAA
jgi:hypothetical protein